MVDLKMSLHDNSKHFFEESLKNAIDSEKDKTRWKLAILFLVQAIELAFKARLKEDNPIFIYSNIDKPKHTVSLSMALKRLMNISELRISETDIQTIETAIEWRNRVVHFEFEFETILIKSVYSKLLGFYISFNQKYLDEDIYSLLSKELADEAIHIEEYLNELLNRVQQRMRDEKIDENYIIDCPSCVNNTFVTENEINTCYLCGNTEELISCEDCGESDFEINMVEIYIGNYKGNDQTKFVCHDCSIKYGGDIDEPWDYNPS